MRSPDHKEDRCNKAEEGRCTIQVDNSKVDKGDQGMVHKGKCKGCKEDIEDN